MARTSSPAKRVGLTSSTLELNDKAAARFTHSSIPFDRRIHSTKLTRLPTMAWRMASMLLVALTLAAAAARADAGWSYGASKFRITGTVLCQDCTKNWNTYAYNAKPINGTFPYTPLIFF
jgi:hypothetical protein